VFVVSGPAADDQVVLQASDGTIMARQPLTNGSAVVPDPGSVASATVSGPHAAPVRVAPADAHHGALDLN
jgi:hypothetical protein